MKPPMKHVVRLEVYCHHQQSYARVGNLALDKRGLIYFQYDGDWLAHGFDLAPGMMSFDHSLQLAKDRHVFQGLHGAFNDSLPDGWGLLLMDRALQNNAGWLPHEITPLDRLAYLGERAMGALEYRPGLIGEEIDDQIKLSQLASEVHLIVAGDAQTVLQDLMIQGGSPAGARPKITVARRRNGAEYRSGFLDLPADFEHWLIKFHAQNDVKESGRIECAYATMAQAAQLQMPAVDLLDIVVKRQHENFFAVKRFDRVYDSVNQRHQKKHVLTLSGYAYADHRLPSIDYRDVLGITQLLTRSAVEVERAFRLMVFNVLAHNKDDHAKNFSFMLDANDRHWQLSPAYDLTFNAGINNHHTTAINGQGNPALADLHHIATEFSIRRAEKIIAEVHAATADWLYFAKKWRVSSQPAKQIEQALTKIRKRLFEN